MASNALTMFDPKVGVPAHIAAAEAALGSNVEGGPKVNSLSPQGRQWTVSINGEKTVLQRKNVDGDLEPVGTLPVIILDYAKRRGRAYYEGAYDPNKEGAPICWSDDGIAPPTNVPKRQADKCADCPMAVKGSKVSDQGKALAACSQHRMLAVIPAFNIGSVPPLRLKIAITSDFDKQSPEATAEGWLAFSQYTDFLVSRGVKHSAMLVTKMKFDQKATYPKIFFRSDRWLDEDELAKVTPIAKDPETLKLLGGTWTPAGPDGVKVDEQPSPAAPTATETVVTATATVVEDDEDDSGIIMGLDAEPAQQAQEPAQVAVKPAKAASKPEPAKAAVVAAEAVPEASTNVPPDVADLLKDWGA